MELQTKNGSKKFVKISLDKSLRMVLTVSLAVILVASVFAVYIVKTKYKYTERKLPVYSYTNNASVSYNVFLSPNGVIDEKKLSAGKVYITSLVDYIDTSFRYEFRGDGPAQIKGKYNVTAALEGVITGDKEDKILWRKEYILKPDTDFSAMDNMLALKYKAPINIKTYTGYANNILRTLNIGCNIRLLIKWNVSYDIRSEKVSLSDTLAPTMEIPINESYFEVGGNPNMDKNGTVEENGKVLSGTYGRNIVLYSTVLVLSLLALLFVLILTAAVPVNILHKEVKRIFKLHGSRMVALNTDMDISSMEMIEISSVEGLVKIADDTGRPVLYKNCKNIKEISIFYVIEQGNIYLLDVRKCISDMLVDSDQETGGS